MLKLSLYLLLSHVVWTESDKLAKIFQIELKKAIKLLKLMNKIGKIIKLKQDLG